MRIALVVPILFLLASIPLAQCQDDSYGGAFSPEQLDNLVAPIALYPDPLLAQVLLAATFPDQIDEAARFVRASQDPGYIDEEPWDVSVKAVAHYPTVMSMMADKLDWTTALGQAYVNQSSDVMTAVQRLRVEARSAGNLVTTPEQEIVMDGGYIQIWPAQPQYIYVPVYDPALVYVRGGYFVGISFGRAFFIGAWLNHDFDWRYNRVYYHGWEDGGRGWMMRSRSYVHVNNVYVNVNYRNVYVNRTVVNRNVNYDTLNRYHSVHREVNYNNIHVNNYNRTVVNNNRTVYNNNQPAVQNKVIERNINTNDTRIDSYRGRQPQAWQPSQPQPNRPEYTRPETPRPQVSQPQVNQPAYNRPNTNVPAAQTQNWKSGSETSAFGGNHSGFDTHAASQRGQESRAQAAKPVPSNPPPGNGDKGSRDKDRRR